MFLTVYLSIISTALLFAVSIIWCMYADVKKALEDSNKQSLISAQFDKQRRMDLIKQINVLRSQIIEAEAKSTVREAQEVYDAMDLQEEIEKLTEGEEGEYGIGI